MGIELCKVGTFKGTFHHGILINLVYHACFAELLSENSILLNSKSPVIYQDGRLGILDLACYLVYNRLFQFYLCH